MPPKTKNDVPARSPGFALAAAFAATFIAGIMAGTSAPSASAQGETTGAAAAQYEESEAAGSEAELPPEVAVPAVGAGSWVVTDARSGEVLAGARADREVPMASTTKIMTALVALEDADLDEEVTVSALAASFAIPEYSNAGLAEGDVLSVRELLYATLVVSGNDAAIALAEHVGGGGGERGVDRFVGRMNEEAQRLGLDETRFENPTGLDEDGHYSSARDLASLARTARDSDLFDEITATEYTTVATRNRTIELTNVNELLYLYPAATGVKTGTSPGAGPSLVGSAAADEEEYISVILDSGDRFGETIGILDYAFAAYDFRAVVAEGEEFESMEVPFRRDESVTLEAGRDVDALVGAGSRIETEVRLPEELPGAAAEGDEVGAVVLTVDGERIGESPLVTARGYEEASSLQKLGYTVSRLWN